jgi:hypothetical protein
VQDDIGAGSFSVDELNARMAARQQALNDGNKAEWDNQGVDSPDYGNAMSKEPRPTDYDSHGQSRFGVSESPSEQSAGKAPRSKASE